MRRFYKIRWLLILSVLSVTPYAAWADSAGDYQQRLDQIRDKITHVLSALGQNKGQRDTVRSELKKLEVKIAISAKTLRKTKRKYKKSVKKLKKSKVALKKLNKSLISQQKILGDQVRSAYTMGQQPQLKMLLNQQKPAEMGRAMIYYRYLNQARGKEIDTFIATIEKQRKLQVSIKKTAEQQAKLVSLKKREKKKLGKNRAKRKTLLAQLNKDIDSQELTLGDLQSSRGRIEELLMSLGELLADIPAEAENQKPFAQMRGKLPWPVKGGFRANFGTTRHQGDLRWNGVVIKADYDTRVRAVTHGRVAFADWLQGYGFITIIDHNDGYMSLYGYTQELYKQVGDWVEASEVIATVGDSGGQLKSGLYFEIRKMGKPINPKKWCRSSVKHLALNDS